MSNQKMLIGYYRLSLEDGSAGDTVISCIVVHTVREKRIPDALPEKQMTKCWSIWCWQK